jgi:AcrR family transcriptional regulator
MTSARTRRRRRAAEGERKRDVTRRHLLDCALALFQKRGVDSTTMRDIASAAGLSLGAAYYHFPSKEALIFAYYEDNQARLDALAAEASA